MKIPSKTAAELAADLLIQKGTHPCRILYARDDRSQWDSEMIVVTVAILTATGEVIGKLTDRITEKSARGQRLRNFCEAFGLVDTGELKAADCIGRIARCEVIVKRSDKYGTRNEIAAYFAGPVLAASSERTGTTS